MPMFRAETWTVLATADPNWFYSTLAQSTAAIVGFAGGFLASRLMTHRTEIARNREELRTPFRNLLNSVSRNDVEVRAVAVSPAGIIELLDQQEETGTAAPVDLSGAWTLRPNGGSISPGVVTPTADQTQKLREFYAVAVEARDAFDDLTPGALGKALQDERGKLPQQGHDWITDIGGFQPPQLPNDYWLDPANQREYAKARWWSVNAEFIGLRDRVTRFKTQLVPRSTLVLLGLLWALLLGCCLVPMAYLSARGDAAKAALLAVFGVLASSTLGYTWWEITRIRGAADLSKPF